jgi:tRNA threonylcarbamoyl adenosine modification protein (Sua5/YciO/YrdC/YwlC family)
MSVFQVTMQTQIAQKSSQIILEIIQRLEAGEVIILPTATTYALVANANNPQAVSQVADLKHWRTSQPLALFTRKERAAEVMHLNRNIEMMMSHFPYPVTMIVPKKDSVLNEVTGGYQNLLVTCPDDFIYDLVAEVPFPLACGSAGRGEARATSCKAAMQLFEGEVPLIVDGGQSKYGRSGTLIDFTTEIPAIMKYGPVSVDDLRPLLPEVELPSHMRK